MSGTVLGTGNTDLNNADMVLTQTANSLVEVREEQMGNYKECGKRQVVALRHPKGVPAPELVSKRDLPGKVTST